MVSPYRPHSGHLLVAEIRSVISRLIETRDERRDRFVQNAIETRLRPSSDKVLKVLTEQGISRTLAKKTLGVARRHRAFTIVAVVETLTRISGKLANAGEQSAMDQKASALQSLAT